jgi:hypothetical protein
VAEVRATLRAALDAKSLDQPYGLADDAPAFAEFVADEKAPEKSDAVVRRVELDRLRGTVELLPERAPTWSCAATVSAGVSRPGSRSSRWSRASLGKGQPAAAEVRVPAKGRLKQRGFAPSCDTTLREQRPGAVLGGADHQHDADRDQHEGAAGVQGPPESHQQREEQPGRENREQQSRLGACDGGDHYREQQQADAGRPERVPEPASTPAVPRGTAPHHLLYPHS